MSQENIAIAIVVALIVLFMIAKFIPKQMPKEKAFLCSRCKKSAMHTHRTVEAWRSGKTKFFCHSCHQKWRQSQPATVKNSVRSYGASKQGAGCLGILAVLVFVPIGATFWAMYV